MRGVGKSFAAALMLALMAVTASSRPSSAQTQMPDSSEPVTFFGVTFPIQIAGAVRISVRDYERTQAGLGYSAGYRDGERITTVYVYDQQLAKIPDDLEAPVVASEFETAKQDVYSRRQWGDDVDFKRDFTISDGRKRTRFICSAFAIVHEGKTLDSFLCLGVRNDKFVKFRITGPRVSKAETEARNFIDAWVQTLWPKG